MRFVNGRGVRTFERADGKARVIIVARDDGRFAFAGETEVEENGSVFWMPMPPSGVYDSIGTAQSEATNHIPWLRQLLAEDDD